MSLEVLVKEDGKQRWITLKKLNDILNPQEFYGLGACDEDFLIEMDNLFKDIDVRLEFQKFKDFLKAKGKRYKNYRAAFRNWLKSPYVPKKMKGGMF